ncbi:MAG TPA: hypothetical protein VGE88_19055 [Lysobacter sp.]
MAALPASVQQSPTVTAIYSWWENKLDRLSRRLGASQIGRPCDRELWYSFRWCGTGAKFDGRMKRLFNRGHREEQVFTDELRAIGLTVHDLDPSTGEQFTFTACGGHFVAKIDGVALGVIEAPKTWHNVSYKTSNTKNFAKILKEGLAKAKPEHVAQNQIEMRLASLERTLYLVVNKDDDTLHAERIRYDAAEAERLEQRAERIIFAPEPPAGISTDPTWYQCRGCSSYNSCHGARLPKPSCRTCLHATPERDGDGRWSCAKWQSDVPTDAQAEGCEHHRYIPALLAKWGEAVDASETEGWVEYHSADGFTFRNGEWGEHSFTSKELHAASPELLRDEEFQAIRTRYAGQIVEREEMEEAA